MAERYDFKIDLNEDSAHSRAARFDVIVLADVLEHLREPRVVLRRLRGFLNGDGYVVASIPNVAHAAVALELRGQLRVPPVRVAR
jgi:2-polyprenyl-3-methyl-5-hydroxy-6-metoxy-1,4-benzoquinol methylase